MIDPPKATKGRRMSKKTPKKSAEALSRRTAVKSRNKVPAKKAKPAASKSAGRTGKPVRSTTAGASSQRSSKQPKKAITSATHKSALVEGATAPTFRLPRDGGATVSLSDYSGKKLVLFFYPRADTPGCTREAIDFARLASAFAENHTAIVGISADPPKAQEAFRDKHRLTMPLVSDEKHGMLEAYGVWGEKSMYGRTFQGIVRTTVLIDADGRIAKIWRQVKVDGHAEEVLAAARSL
jgi:peroxiredoxin Q/BCP